MEFIIAVALGALGVKIVRSLLLGTATSRQSKRNTGEYVSTSYRLKIGRSIRSEYAANQELARR